ncbi:MarR family winged helix-turn-helix transcriptional regulator [Reinekea marinisedimentorum]|uniref:DNA-binding MarR family transcriptional regulator n=1 Tax=Reinekea marinisedimentorum TaxID=230495 RepID=A0A4R3I3E1_9GAMM|nr:MarR family transcriptional regulator [Reinekea marinisedimentorum]TCS40334.1 DNA-binding MarR family transcriptional regulator [Reinekea marinisedimentorum]
MSTPNELKLENQICHSIYSATNALIRAYRPLLEALDLTYPQYLVMMALWEEDGVMIKRLVERTRLDAGTLTPILKRLEAKGLVSRQKSHEDSRQKLLKVADKGLALRDKAAKVPAALTCQVQMTLEEATLLKQLSEKLYKQLVAAV